MYGRRLLGVLVKRGQNSEKRLLPGVGQIIEVFLYDRYNALFDRVVLGLIAVMQPFIKAVQQCAVHAIRFCFLHHFNKLFPILLQTENDAVINIF